MSKYVYKSPVEQGAKKIKLTEELHEQVCNGRKPELTKSYDYFLSVDEEGNDNNYLIIEEYWSYFASTVNVLMLPINIISYGLSNFKEICDNTFNQFKPIARKKGKFCSDKIFKCNIEGDVWELLVKEYNK